MPNKNYVKGANFEREIKKFYESLGYLVFRTAGSHSPADLIAFPPLGNIKEWQPILIQCKATQSLRITETELNNLKNNALKYGLRAKLIVNIRDSKTGRYGEVWIVKA